MTTIGRWLAGAACALGMLAGGPAFASAEAAWTALKAGGAVLVIRHAKTEPGVGDPPQFRLDDCTTQRNLSDEGREQARALGARLREASVRIGPVLTSHWCRCVDTARLAFGHAQPFAPLDSFFGERTREPAQTAALRERIRAHRGPGTLVLVTHQVNMTALTGEAPAMGEALVLVPADAGFALAGRIAF